jgi:ATP-dependent DNA ligase
VSIAEFFVGGWAENFAPMGEGKNFKFAGRVGTGFSDKLLRSLFDDLQKILVESCPYSNLPAPGRNRWDQGLSAAKTKPCRWVKPVMVCQVKLTKWTGMIVSVSRCSPESGKTRRQESE